MTTPVKRKFVETAPCNSAASRHPTARIIARIPALMASGNCDHAPVSSTRSASPRASSTLLRGLLRRSDARQSEDVDTQSLTFRDRSLGSWHSTTELHPRECSRIVASDRTLPQNPALHWGLRGAATFPGRWGLYSGRWKRASRLGRGFAASIFFSLVRNCCSWSGSPKWPTRTATVIWGGWD